MSTSTSDPSAGPGVAALSLEEALRAEAAQIGFAACGVTTPDAIAAMGADAALRAWVADNRHGAMGWMADRLEWRADPRVLWPAARSAILLADNYGPAADPMALLGAPECGVVSVYAQGRDYHDALKKKLKRLGRWLIDTLAPDPCEIKVFVDTAPLMEKPLAEAAGIGWRGKHTNLVSRQGGSWFFLGAVLTTAELRPDTPSPDHCGACRRCLDICPTAAFPAPYQLDARRCIAYWTIEAPDQIPRSFRAAIGNRIYGCDDCLAVCPWNKFAEAAEESAYWARVELRAPDLADLAALDDAAFREVFRGSPIKRIGRERFVRNVLVAIGNAQRERFAPIVERLLDDAAPMVRGMAVWAFARLAPDRARAAAPLRFAAERDPDVRDEWTAILAAS